jgi:hypothetical protein
MPIERIDAIAQTIDVHIAEDGKAALLTVVCLFPDRTISVTLRREALETLQARISRALSEATPDAAPR